MTKFIHSDGFLAVIVSLILILLGYVGVSSASYPTIGFISIAGLATIFLAYFYPKYICYAIIIAAPLSINLTGISGGLALSLPAEGLLGLILLLTGIKLFAGLKYDKDLLKHPITIILLLDILWLWITCVYSTIPEVSLKRAILKTSFIFGFYFLFYHVFQHRSKGHSLFILTAVGALIPIIYAINNHAAYNFAQEDSFEMSDPFYEDHTLYGACLAFLVPYFLVFIFEQWKNGKFSFRWIPITLFTVILLFAEFLSYSRAAWISVFVALGIYVLTKFKIKPKIYFSAAAILIVAFVIQFGTIYQNIRSGNAQRKADSAETHLSSVTDLKSNASNLERVNRWVCAYRMFEEKPILGWGAGTYQFQYAKFQSNEFTTMISVNSGDRGNSHSEYLTLLSEEGFVGLLLFILLIIYSFARGIKLLIEEKIVKNKIVIYGALLGLITFYSHGLFNAFSDYEKMSIMVYGSLAIITLFDVRKHRATNHS